MNENATPPDARPISERVDAPPLTTPSDPRVQWRPAVEADIDAIQALAAASDRVDHPTWITPREDIADVFELSHVEVARDTLVAVVDDELVAWGWAMVHPVQDVELHGYLQGTVRPDWRRRGLGAQLMAWLYARVCEMFVETEATVPAAVFLYVEEGNDGAVVLGERLGLRTERWFTAMHRDLSEPIVVPAAAEGVELVAYTSERAEDARIARNDSFRDHWGSLESAPERWEQFVGGPFLRPDLSTLALVDGRIVAFCLASVNEEDWAALGASHTYIDLIGVVRDQRGRGLAPAVIARTLVAAKAAGLEQAVLDVDTASPTGAHTLYERLGFTATQRQQVLVRRF
ncbi:hypothetical protein ASD65_15510 [Microbacterium sp. Root61]|uniref:GNAT family N-acetyltransferase n=1 Tax=Microbacterium sp. Root61 TaxID=1736570 RepID=UPI000700FC80|nr:GNAT family N-acetyltransferase [Microbacterium sp. Root61]KRA25669.1 hypothetical protein ASD65_15510 [Microbacterium sp. Root61]